MRGIAKSKASFAEIHENFEAHDRDRASRGRSSHREIPENSNTLLNPIMAHVHAIIGMPEIVTRPQASQ